jgi:DNA-binding winged helix-turn-helix (wHTH) protein/tetratricopeptide (TPR) repeat protein
VNISTGPIPVDRLPTVSFGTCRLDRSSRELRMPGQCVRLQEKPFQILSLLLERAGDVVTREELRRKLWPSSVYIDFDHGLNNAITRLRETLGDNAAEPRYIETLPRLGYRFIHPVAAAETAAGSTDESGPDRAAPEPAAAIPLLARLATRLAWPASITAIAIIAAIIALGLLVALGLTRSDTDRGQRMAASPATQASAVRLQEQPLSAPGTKDSEAHRLYLLGNALLTGISVKRDLPRARQLFEQAIARDPQYAAAHARLAYYHFYGAWALLGDVDADVRDGMAAARRAVELNPASSEALQARANFAMWRYRFLGDYEAFVAASSDYRRAIQLDPQNHTAVFDYGRAVLWHEPDLAQSLFERTVRIEPLRRRAAGMAALTVAMRGDPEAAREQLRDQAEQVLGRRPSEEAGVAGFEQYFGRLDEAVVAARVALARGGPQGPIQLWGLYMSLGERDAAGNVLDFGETRLADSLREAAMLTMAGRYGDAYEHLDRRRDEFARNRVLDLPAARLALIAGRPAPALAILEQRLPDLVSGVEPISARNVMPALDLVAAWQALGDDAQARRFLDRIIAYLDDPSSPRLPMFLYLRARAHALAREEAPAMQALDRAYDAGFRTTWANDLHPQPHFYIDPVEADPVFAALRSQPRYQAWIARIRDDNARQLKRLKARDAVGPAA